MKELEKEFIGKGQVKGFKFTQVKKTKYGYIYKVDTKHTIMYEVFKRKENNRFKCISYPTNKSFGIWAWTYKNLDSALDRLDNFIVRKEQTND
tara:strand:- start:264 stop:542 length:279 start_codon:yes stop_codon:yes gene_type:complete